MAQESETRYNDPLKGIRSSLLGMLANLGLAIIKATAGIVGQTYALVADSIESSMDIVSSLVVLGGLKIASAPPDEKHPYGHGKAESIAAIIVALALILAAMIIAIQSYREIITPHHTPAPWTLIVLVLVVVTKSLLFKFVAGVGHEIESTAVKTDAWHHMSDALTSVAAFIGISIAVIFGKYGKNLSNADDWATLFMTVIILYNGIRLLRPALDEIMDASAPDEVIKEVCRIASSVKGVITTEKCRVRKAGLGYIVDLHIHVNGNIPVTQGHEIAHLVSEAMHHSQYRIFDISIHVEPAENSGK
jgi:cation diffusion facilitator family transporter